MAGSCSPNLGFNFFFIITALMKALAGSSKMFLLASSLDACYLGTDSAHLRFRNRSGSDSVQLGFVSDQVQTQFSSCLDSAQLRFRRRSSSGSVQLGFSSGSESDQVQIQLRSLAHIRLSLDQRKLRFGSGPVLAFSEIIIPLASKSILSALFSGLEEDFWGHPPGEGGSFFFWPWASFSAHPTGWVVQLLGGVLGKFFSAHPPRAKGGGSFLCF